MVTKVTLTCASCIFSIFHGNKTYESQTIFTDQVSILIYFISGNDYSDYSIEDPDIPDWWKGMFRTAGNYYKYLSTGKPPVCYPGETEQRSRCTFCRCLHGQWLCMGQDGGGDICLRDGVEDDGQDYQYGVEGEDGGQDYQYGVEGGDGGQDYQYGVEGEDGGQDYEYGVEGEDGGQDYQYGVEGEDGGQEYQF